ncbi:hypothetical protein ES702_05054 [subsurface metagenome]
MPDWTASFHLPHFTDAEFSAMRKKYAAKYGYTVTVPGLSDIIITDMFERMSPEEIKAWKRRDYDFFSENRYDAIRAHKNKKKQRFLALLGSPTPDIFHHVGSIMTSLDDCQDALATLGFLGRLLIKVVPATLGKAFLGPVGWLLAAADLMRFATVASVLIKPKQKGKRAYDYSVKENIEANKVKIRRAKKLLQFMPDSADIAQLLQVTGQMFGFGICLGPIIGLAEDLFAGFIRLALGQEVHFKAPPTTLPSWLQSVCNALSGAGYVLSNPFETDEPMLTDVILAAYLANQVMAPILKQWHPIDNVPNIQDLHFMAPIPKDPLTIEVIEEEGIDVLATCSWPHNNQMWTKIGDFWEYGKDVATDNLYHMIRLNSHNRRGQLISHLGNEIAYQSMANLVGEENVVYDYTAAKKAASAMINAGYQLSEHITPDKLQNLVDWLNELDAIDDSPTFKELSLYCKNNDIPLVPYGSESKGSLF